MIPYVESKRTIRLALSKVKNFINEWIFHIQRNQAEDDPTENHEYGS